MEVAPEPGSFLDNDIDRLSARTRKLGVAALAVHQGCGLAGELVHESLVAGPEGLADRSGTDLQLTESLAQVHQRGDVGFPSRFPDRRHGVCRIVAVYHEGDVRGSDSCRDRLDHPAVQRRLVGLADRLVQPVERREWMAPLTEQAALQCLADASPHRLDQHHPDDGDSHRHPAILELVETFTDQEQGSEVHRDEEGCDEGSQGSVNRCPLHDHADVVELGAQHRETNDGNHDNRPQHRASPPTGEAGINTAAKMKPTFTTT